MPHAATLAATLQLIRRRYDAPCCCCRYYATPCHATLITLFDAIFATPLRHFAAAIAVRATRTLSPLSLIFACRYAIDAYAAYRHTLIRADAIIFAAVAFSLRYAVAIADMPCLIRFS